MRRLAANSVPGVAHGLELVAGDIQRRLQPHPLADVELVLPFRADLAHYAGHLVPEHRRPRGDVARNALVPRSKRHALVVAQANRVGDEFDDDSLFVGRLQFYILQPGVARAV